MARDVYLSISNPNKSSNFSFLTSNSKYPQNPDCYHFIEVFDAPRNFDDNYCQRIRGWFQAAVSGNYTFYTSCDDFCDLYLSEDIDPGKKNLIVSQKSCSCELQWDK